MSIKEIERFNIRITAVKKYLEGNTTEEVSSSFNIHPKTLKRWIRWYKEGGEENLRREWILQRHHRRLDSPLEQEIVTMKEREPALTVSQARDSLEKDGMRISRKGIWNTWKRFGMTGFHKEHLSTSYRDYLSTFGVRENRLSKIQALIELKKIEEAAEIINALPVFPYPEELKKIPEKLLSQKRKLDRLSGEFGIIPLSEYYRKAKTIREKLEQRNEFYSSLRAGIEEGYALIWMGEPTKLLELSSILKKRARRIRDPGLQFALLLFSGHALGSLLKIKAALKCTNKCKIIIRNLSRKHFFKGELAGLYSVLGYYKEAIKLTEDAIENADGEYKKHLNASLAGFFTTAGEYQKAFRILREENPKGWDYHSRGMLIKAFAFLDKGDFHESATLAVKALEQSKKEEIRRFLHLSTFILACSHAAAGERKEAESLLKKYIPLLKKHRLEKEYLLRKILLRDRSPSKRTLSVPNLRLADLFLKAERTKYIKDYRKALRFGRSQKLFGLFERLALFFPESVLHILKKGKDPGLPKSFLKMPVFQIHPPVYHLKFLGRPHITKGDKALRGIRMSPKEIAFLITLSFRKTREIQLKSLYSNYWPSSKNPSRNLSHLLVRIRRILSLPTHFIGIHNDLLSWDFYLSTDYVLYKETIVQAKALHRTGEWSYAKKEYLRAFKLFRGEPFKKMYDDWSDDKRLEVLFSYETDVLAFSKELIKRERKKEAERLLKKAEKIVPYSEEIKDLLYQAKH